MRALLIPAALVAAFAATPALADCTPAIRAPVAATPIVVVDAGAPAVPALLAPLAADSPWTPRFAAAADELLAALRSGDPARWQPLLGGIWLGVRERQAVAALLAERCGPFANLLGAPTPPVTRVLGWRPAGSYSAAELADIAARPEAEALVCWAAKDAPAGPATAAEADNAPGRPYACARITYSLRGGAPRWRAFIEAPVA